MIIPDSIQPYIGYKALRIKDDNLLYSPSYEFLWRPGKRVEAVCPAGHMSMDWVKREGEPPVAPMKPGQRGSPYYYGRVIWTTATIVDPISTPPPQEPLEKGWHWSYELIKHVPGDPHCTCGIYVVEDIPSTNGYMATDTVVCQIAVWGKTTLGHKGARGQYAYPQVMYVPNHLKEKSVAVAANYGIETKPQEFVSGYEPHILKQRLAKTATLHASAAAKRDARNAALFFVVLALAAMAFACVCSFTEQPWYVFSIPFGLSLIFSLISMVANADARRED